MKFCLHALLEKIPLRLLKEYGLSQAERGVEFEYLGQNISLVLEILNLPHEVDRYGQDEHKNEVEKDCERLGHRSALKDECCHVRERHDPKRVQQQSPHSIAQSNPESKEDCYVCSNNQVQLNHVESEVCNPVSR